MDALVIELVQQAVAETDPDDHSLHANIVNRVERETIAQVLQECGGVQTKAANRLGINRNTLHKKVKEYDLDD